MLAKKLFVVSAVAGSLNTVGAETPRPAMRWEI